MEKHAKDSPKPLITANAHQVNIQTLDSMYARLNYLSRSGNVPFIAEMVRRLLDRWALGDDPDPWLPFPAGFWSNNSFPKVSLKSIGFLRYLWSSPDPMFRPVCKCGAYRYALDYGMWLTGGWGYFICIGCNSFKSDLTGGLSTMNKKFDNNPFRVYQSKKDEADKPEPADMIKLLNFLKMKGNLRSLLKINPLDERG